MEERKEEKRRLLYVELSFQGVPTVPYQDGIRKKIDLLDKYGYLEHFREKNDKPYFKWYGTPSGYGTFAFVIRVKSPYDVEYIENILKDIEGTTKVYSSWFPSRHDYGGTVQKDGSVIETWDI